MLGSLYEARGAHHHSIVLSLLEMGSQDMIAFSSYSIVLSVFCTSCFEVRSNRRKLSKSYNYDFASTVVSFNNRQNLNVKEKALLRYWIYLGGWLIITK